MRKKFIIAMLIVCVVTGSIYNKPMQAKAAASSAAVTSYVAEKVFLALLALAGVAVKSSDIEFIWDEGGLNVDALINNMMAYSRDLGMGMRQALSLGAAGATTLMLQRNMWNLFKGWARDKYGTDENVSTTVSTNVTKIKPIPSGKAWQLAYIQNSIIGWVNYVPTTECLVFKREIYSSGAINPWYVYLYFVPTTYRSGSDLESLSSATVGGNDVMGSWGSLNLSSEVGGCRYWGFGTNQSETFESFEGASVIYDISYVGNTSSEIRAELARLTTLYRDGQDLTVTRNITASPVEGVDDESATTAGQDVVGYDTTATQEGQDVILEGPLAVALPDAATLEVLLKQLADEDITYEDYVRALGLAAVKTTDTTAEDVRQKEQTITVNPVAGNYTVSLDSLFPFCIPFDLYDILAAFNAEPSAPQVTISIPTGYDGDTFTWHEYTISLSDFDTVAQVVRIFEYIIFCIGLMLMTRKLIEG